MHGRRARLRLRVRLRIFEKMADIVKNPALILKGGNMLEFVPSVFNADFGCRWTYFGNERLRLNDHYIAGPEETEDREDWLLALQTYRRKIRAGEIPNVVDINIDNYATWVKLSLEISKAFGFRPGEGVHIASEARWNKGYNDLCVAFGIYNRSDNSLAGQTDVIIDFSIPKDGQWHLVKAEIRVPDFDPDTQFLCPMLGLNSPAEPTQIQVMNVGFRINDDKRMEKAASVVRDQLKGQ